MSDVMKKCYFTRNEISQDLGIDPKTLRKRLRKAGLLLEKGLIPALKVNEIKIRLEVEVQNQDESVINEPTDINFKKIDRSSIDSQ